MSVAVGWATGCEKLTSVCDFGQILCKIAIFAMKNWFWNRHGHKVWKGGMLDRICAIIIQKFIYYH